MTFKTRFAPSPTGHLHVGNLRTAIQNWLFARKYGGEFWLRLDDTDAERSRDEYANSIRADLDWLGLTPDGEVKQSDRFALYEAQFDDLRAKGRVYPCFESAQELDLKRKVALGRGLPPVYDRAALGLSADEVAAKIAAGEAPHWRFWLDHDAPIAWNDLIRGPQSFDPKLLSDPVIRRADGSWLYMLPSVIDDIDMGVTHIVRGEDHVSNSATQLQMFSALGAELPQLAHAALLTGAEGKLSKRLGSLGVSAFRESGIEAITLLAMLARLGTSDAIEPVTQVAPLLASFDFGKYSRAPARFDEQELALLNQKILHQLEFDQVADRLPEGMSADIWAVVRGNIGTLAEASSWWRVIQGTIEVNVAETTEDREYLKLAATLLKSLDWTADVWKRLTDSLKEETGRKGRALFLPLRLALTGHEHGPEMAGLLPLIGPELAVQRLGQAAG